MRCLIRAALGLLLITSGAAAQDADNDQLSRQAFQVLSERCSGCHGGVSPASGIRMLDRATLVGERGDYPIVVPGSPDESDLWDAIQGEQPRMPQPGSPEAAEMTPEERELLREWIEQGATFPDLREFTFVTEKDVLRAIREFLLTTNADDRRYLRFFTFTHLHNNPAVSESDLRYYRAALSKVVNSLSWERNFEIPRPIDGAEGTVFVIDLRNVGWNERNLWLEILKEYPYGLKYDYVLDEEMQQLAKDVTLLSGSDLPYLRADWFIVNAAQPPLYHLLLDIPTHLRDLEHRLDIDFAENFADGQLWRAGFSESGVSRQNRLIERHESRDTPYYWISYDFLPRKARGDLIRFPLGPGFSENPFQNFAFDHDGGEVIFGLPNGLQAYMLVAGDGTRIDEGPVDVVFDRSALLGTPAIVNGISCMNCHVHGMITNFRDEVRGSDALAGLVRQKVLDLYPPTDELAVLTESDQRIFLQALQQTIGSFLQIDEAAEAPIESFKEPIGEIAALYSRDLTVDEVALELGIEDPAELQAAIRANRELRQLGLGTLAQEHPGTIKREKWETVDGTSFFQHVALELRLGTPIVH